MFISLNDIVVAGRLACQLHEMGSSRYTSAYQEYRDFMHDITSLDIALKAIETEVQQFNALPGSTGLDLSSLDIALDGVYDTLRRCEKLLRENPKFQWSQGFIMNIEWNFEIAQHVKNLQTRVLFHCAKINFIIQPLQLRIQSCLGQMLAVVHGDMDARFREVIQRLDLLVAITGRASAEKPRPPPSVPRELAENFASAASLLGSENKISIKDGLNAVVFHYEKSTREFVSQPPTMVKPTSIQYLNLMKCIWLLQKIRASPYFRHFCLDTLSEAYVRQLDRRVDAELRRFESPEALQAPELSELLSEADDKFEIWPDFGMIDIAPAITEASGLEIELFKAPLQSLTRNRSQDLVVFRVGESRLRFAIVVTNPQISVAEKNNYEIDCRKAVLIPIYAHPRNQASHSLSWKAAADDSRTLELPFTTVEGVRKFQEAVTNFGVVSDLSGLSAVRAKASMFDGKDGTELGSKGRVQLWIHRRPQVNNSKPYSTVVAAAGPPAGAISTQRHNSVVSRSGTTTTSTTSPKAWTSHRVSQANPTSSIRNTENGAILDSPVPSQMVLFTLHKNHLRLISIEIDDQVRINPDRCSCTAKKENNTCTRVVIENGGNAKLSVRMYDTNGNDDMFNVAVLGTPAHEGSQRDMEQLFVKRINIDLDTIQVREKLCQDFESVSRIMRNRVKSYNTDLSLMKRRHVHEGG